MPEPLIHVTGDLVEIKRMSLRAAALQADEMLFGWPPLYIPRVKVAVQRDQHGVSHHVFSVDKGEEYIVSVLLDLEVAPAIQTQVRNKGAAPVPNFATDIDIVLTFVCSGRTRDRMEIPLRNVTVAENNQIRALARISNPDEQGLVAELAADSHTEINCRIDRRRCAARLDDLLRMLESWRDFLQRTSEMKQSNDAGVNMWRRVDLREDNEKRRQQLGNYSTGPEPPPEPLDQAAMMLDAGARHLLTMLEQTKTPAFENWRGRAQACIRIADKSVQSVKSDLKPLPVMALPVYVKDREFSALIQWTVGGHHYYQSRAQSNYFYYLPDYYDFNPGPDGIPAFLKIKRLPSGDDFQVDYVAVPRVDKERRLLPHARTELVRYAPAGSVIELFPLLPESDKDTSLTFTVNVPSAADRHGWEPQVRAGAVKNLQKRIADSIAVTAEGLGKMFDALFSESAVLFYGRIKVKMGKLLDEVDFNGRITGDRQSVWDRIFDDSVLSKYKRTVTIEALPQVFADNVVKLTVQLTNGDPVTLTKDTPTAAAITRPDIRKFVLRMTDDGDYEYVVTVHRADNTSSTLAPKTSAEALLEITHV